MNTKLQRYRRNAQVNLAYKYPAELPKINVVLITKRSYLVDDIIAKINSQTMGIDNVYIITQDYTQEDQDKLTNGITNGTVLLEEIPSTDPIKLSGRHKKAIGHIEYGIILIMDDDDVYLPNYIKGQVNMLLRSGADIVVKGDPVVTLADKSRTGWVYPYKTSSNLIIGAGGSLCFTKDVYDKIPFADVDRGYDSIFQNTAHLLKLRIATSDPFNFAIVRGLDDHTWEDKKDITGFGLRINDISFADIEL